MTDVNDTIEHTEEEGISKSSRRAMLGLTGAGIAGAVVMGSKGVQAANGDNVAVGGTYDGDGATDFTNTTATAPIAGPASAVIGRVASATNGSHALNGFTNGQGHAVAGESFNTTADAKAATWGRHSGPAAGAEGVNITPTAPIAGPANGVKGIVTAAGNGSHAVLGITNGGGHAVAGDIPAGTGNTVGATWGRHAGLGAGAEGVNTAANVPIAGTANGVKGTVTDATNGSHAVLGITNGGGHAVAGDTPDGDNVVAATWGRHKGAGAGIGGISVKGYGGEFKGASSQIRLIQDTTGAKGAPTTGTPQMGELYVDGDGNLFLNKGDGFNFTQLNDQAIATPAKGTIAMLAKPERAYDSREGFAPTTSEKTPFTNDTVRVIDLAAGTSFPAGASGALLNVTVTETGKSGYLTVYSNGLADTPGTSNLNWSSAGQTVANAATITTDSMGKIKVYCRGTADVVIDITGYVA